MRSASLKHLASGLVLVAVTSASLQAQVPRLTLDPRMAAPASPPATSQTIGRGTQADPVGNGILLGALVGGGAALGALGVMYARCDEGCEAPEVGPLIGVSLLYGAGGGAIVGWLIDRARTGQGSSGPSSAAGRLSRSRAAVSSSVPRRSTVDVVPIVAGRQKGLHVRVTF